MSKVWFTSDLHIGHKKVAGIRADEAGITRMWKRDENFDLRPCPEFDVAWHDRMLALWWDEMVGPDDLVHVLGDISSGTKDGQENALEWLRKRPGRKRLKYGNHDGPHDMNRDASKWWHTYAQAEVFEDMRLHGRIRIPLAAEGHTDALLSHFPYVGDHTPEDRYTQWRLPDEGTAILHGHTHSQERISYGRHRTGIEFPEGYPIVHQLRSLQLHVGVDAHDYKPVPLSWVIDQINKFQDREAGA